MKYILVVLLSVFSLTLQAQTTQKGMVAVTGNTADLSSLAKKWQEAYNSGDTAKIAALYTPGATYCSAHVPGLVASGRNQVRDYFMGGMKMGGHIDSIIVLSSETRQDLAVFFCKYVATNAGVRVNGRNLIIVKNIDGKWLFDKHMTVVKD